MKTIDDVADQSAAGWTAELVRREELAFEQGVADAKAKLPKSKRKPRRGFDPEYLFDHYCRGFMAVRKPWVVRANGKVFDRCMSESGAKRVKAMLRHCIASGWSVTITHEPI